MTCQGISLGLVSIGCCFFSFLSLEGGASILSSHGVSRRSRGFSLSRIFEFSNFFFTRRIAEITDFFCPDFFFVTNYRIIEYLSHGVSRRSRGFFVPNLRIFSHGMSRKVTDFFVPRLVLGPTDQRGVIAEFLSITRIVADGCGACSSCEWGLFVVVYRPIRGVCV